MSNEIRSLVDYNKTATFIDHPDYLEVRFTGGDSALVSSAASRISERVGKPVKALREYGNKRVDIKWFTDGVLYNPFGGPSNSGVGLDEWTGADGRPHRVGGPSKIERTGQCDRTEWRQNWELHREDGPAISLAYFNTSWPRQCKFGELPKNFNVHDDHRAYFHANERVSLYASREHGFYLRNKLNSIADRASLVSATEVLEAMTLIENGSIIRKTYCDSKTWTWHADGVKHRTTGPAKVVMSNCYEEWKDDILITRQCAGWEVEWCLNGTLLKNHDVNEWLKRHHVLLIEPYRIDGSVWREQQDEFAFVMDFQSKLAA